MMRYIELNPVKAGIIKSPLEYQWSSCRASVEGLEDGLLRSPIRFDADGRSSYRSFLMEQDSMMDEKIRRSTSTGRPLGSDDFVKGLERLLSRKLMAGPVGRPKKEEIGKCP